MYLLDTNVVSELRKPRPDERARAWLESVPNAELLLPAVVLGELQRGVEKLRRRDRASAVPLQEWLEQLASSYQVVPMDGGAFREWARLVEGHPERLEVDAMIAAMAKIHKLTVVSRNVRDFERLGTRVLNPFAPPAQRPSR